MNPQIIRTTDELAALDPDTVVTDGLLTNTAGLAALWTQIGMIGLPVVVIATGDTVRAARQALEAPIPLTDDQTEALTNDRWDFPSHRTEAGYPNCSTCDGGGCPDCTDPA